MAYAVGLPNIAQRVAFPFPCRNELFCRRSKRTSGKVSGCGFRSMGQVLRQVLRSDPGGVGAAMIRVVEPGRRIEYQTGKTFTGDRGNFRRHPPAHGMSHEVGPIQAQCCDEPQVMNDQILHPADVRCRPTFAEAGMKRQIDPKPVG